jgi:excisionase family DNA binding protein
MRRNSVSGAPEMKKRGASGKHTRALADEIMMTIPTLALYLHCHKSTIYRLLKKKQIPAFKIGAVWRFLLSDIDEWLAGRRVTIPPVTRGSAARAARRKRGPKPKLS